MKNGRKFHGPHRESNPGLPSAETRYVVRDVNDQRDENGITYARKAMILCGMSLNTNGIWEIGQLKPELQNIIRKHRAEFDNPEGVEHQE